MSNETVQKGYHCAWQIHYHMVFPVKYRKALIDRDISEIIKETSEGIAERYAIEMEATLQLAAGSFIVVLASWEAI